MALLSYLCSILVFESTRLLTGNYKMKHKVDFESLLSSHITSKSLVVSFTRQLYLIQLVCISSIGIIFSTYTADNLFEVVLGRTWALQLVPEAKIISEINSGLQPFTDNYFCLSMGLLIIFTISLFLYYFDFEKNNYYHPFKSLVILIFLFISISYFVHKHGGIFNVDIDHVPQSTQNFGFVFGVLAFSFSQSVAVPQIITGSQPSLAFKIPLFFALFFVIYSTH